MKKILFWTLLAILSGLLAGCTDGYPTPEPPGDTVVVITVLVTAVPQPTFTPDSSAGPLIIATALITPPTPSQAPSAMPTPEPSAAPNHPGQTPAHPRARLCTRPGDGCVDG